jgi:glycosyltransferase involved in cell wall biosynthesis
VGLGRGAYPCAAVGSPYGWWESPWHLQAKAYHWVEKNIALPRFERVYTVSQDMKRKVLEGRTPEERIRVIHTGIDLATVDGGATREETRAALGIAEKDFVAGTVSRLFREKGHKHLLNAAATLLSRQPQLRLLIVGTGDEREALEAQAAGLGIAERVTFTGFYLDIAGAFRAMDVFVQPSIDAEGFPTSVLEAQAAGLPVIASDIGGTKETLDVGVTGLLVPPADEASLAGALEGLMQEPGRRDAMARAARPWIARRFTMADMLRQMGGMYYEAVDEWRARP